MADIITIIKKWTVEYIFTGAFISFLFALDPKNFSAGMLAVLLLFLTDQILGSIVAIHNHEFKFRRLIVMTTKKLISYVLFVYALSLAGAAITVFSPSLHKIAVFITGGYAVAIVVLAELYSILAHCRYLGLHVRIGEFSVLKFLMRKIQHVAKKSADIDEYVIGNDETINNNEEEEDDDEEVEP